MSYPPRPPGMNLPPGSMPVPYMTGPMMHGAMPGAMPGGMPGGMPPGMMGYHPHSMGPMPPQHMPPPQMRPQSHMPPQQQQQQQQQSPAVISRGPRPAGDNAGPSVTVFVGNITDRAPDNMIRQMLQNCGPVVSWKRVQGASGVLQAFGFCEYSTPEAALRSIRLLHDLDVGEKKLVVKVDAKTKVVLDNYKAEKLKSSGTGPANGESDEFLTQEIRVQDKWVKERIGQTIKDYESEMQANQARAEEKERREQEKEKARAAKKEEANNIDLNKFDSEIEEGKKDLITREIGKFREIAKKQDEEKEAERRKRKEKERERERRDRERDRDRERERDRERDRGSGRGNDRERDRRRERTPERDGRRRDGREKENDNHHRGRSRSPPSRRSRSPPAPPVAAPATPPPPTVARRSRSRDRTEPEVRPPRRSEKDYLREKEEEEEALERKKAEKKAREKEIAYQERLRHWETRERKKQREYEKAESKEKEKHDEQQKQALWLKQFLEDYDDERDDAKYYKGREMEKRRAEREKEIESDNRDRQKEKDELEELKNKIFAEGHSDPNATFKQALYEREQQYKPKILLPAPPVNEPRRPHSPVEESQPSHHSDEFVLSKQANSPTPLSSAPSTPTGKDMKVNSSSVSSSVVAIEEDSMSTSAASLSPVPTESDSKQSSQGPSLVFAKRKKLEIKAVFNADEDEITAPKKRKLVPLDYGDEIGKNKPEKEPKNTEEKRKNIKSLIEKIPTDKASLFAHPVEWSLVDNVIMERRIKPWVNKKIVEYIGEPEPTLVDFICSKVLIGSQPQSIINDVQMVLDEEAEVFVVKMWRLLIYELEAKKLGLMK